MFLLSGLADRAAALLRRAVVATALVGGLATAMPAAGADRARIEAFLQVTGYDVVIESLQQNAMTAPALTGDFGSRFGQQYSGLAAEVFDVPLMQARALDILEGVLGDDLLHAGAEFYASDLGQRLVEVENASHLATSAQRQAEGQQITDGLRRGNPDRIGMFMAMTRAVGSEEVARRAMVEVQVRFLLAAETAGVLQFSLSEEELRQRLIQSAMQRQEQIRAMGLNAAAWTYRDISDADLAAYVAALERSELRQLYEILNAVQYQVMIERYEALGLRLAELTPELEL